MVFKVLIILCFAFNAAVSGKDTRIIGGLDANLQNTIYHASLRRISNDQHICGGAVISELHILTTAYCVDIRFNIYNDLKIRTGGFETVDLERSTHFPDKIFSHPKYKGFVEVNSNNFYDIAIIKLKEAITFNRFQRNILLPIKNILNNSIGIVSGWGAITNPPNIFANKLQIAWMTILDIDHCNQKLPFKLNSDQFCAFQKPGVGVGFGDGGSPIVINNRVVGLVVSSRPFATGEPEIYSNVFSHIDFITAIVN